MILAFILLTTQTFALGRPKDAPSAAPKDTSECSWSDAVFWPVCGQPKCGDDEYPAASTLDGGNHKGSGEPCATGWKIYCCKKSFWSEDISKEIPCNKIVNQYEGHFCGLENNVYYVCGGSASAHYCDYSTKKCTRDEGVVSQTWSGGYKKKDRPFDDTFTKLKQRCVAPTQVYDRFDGWCIGEEHRENIGNPGSEANCLEECGKKRYEITVGSFLGGGHQKSVVAPAGCEYSRHYNSCAAFWGWPRTSGQSGNYVCHLKGGPRADWNNIAMTSEAHSSPVLLYVFAAFGFATTLYGSFKFYCGKKE